MDRVFILVFCLAASAAFFCCGRTEKKISTEEGKPVNVISKPFRVLVIIGDQWTDPMSYNIDPFRVKNEDFLDVGCSEQAWSLTWHYPTPAKDTLIRYLIEPLEKYGKMMVQNITPEFANPEKKLIESSWDVPPFTDIFGNWQDFGSTKEGLDEGLRRGVFEVQPHRAWSHMNWDLDSPPGPWWGSPVDGEMKITDWYNEVVDVRRGHAPVPSNDLLFIYKKGIEAIQKSFGVTPLAAEVRPGAELKKGTHGGDGRRLNVHDNLNWIESRKDKYWMGFNETCAYLHFEISDNFRHALGTGVSILVDGKPALTGLSASQKIEIPAGLGIHTLKVVSN